MTDATGSVFMDIMKAAMDNFRTLYLICFLILINFFLQIFGSTTDSSDDSTTEAATSRERNKEIKDDGLSFLEKFPQSALSMIGLGLFILLSIVIAYGMEKLYERTSIRDDSSDMSETTKNILKARVLGMVFGKKDDFENLKGREREKALSKKYFQKWHYNMIMMRKRRKKKDSLSRTPKRGSIFSFSKRNSSVAKSTMFKEIAITEESPDEVTPVSPAKGKANGDVTKDSPSVANQKITATSKPPKICRSPTKSEFVAVEMKFAEDIEEESTVKTEQAKILIPTKENKDGATIVGLADTSLEDDEFAIDMKPMPSTRSNAPNALNKTKSGSKHDISSLGKDSDITSQKYIPTPSPKPASLAQKLKSIRPLTAGKSRQIAPGGVQRTNNADSYKQQGTSVRSDVMKNPTLGQTKR